MQIVLTSYRRLNYLKRTVASLRQDTVSIFIADGGSDEETVNWIKQNADGWLLFDNNPGADVLRTEGIKEFVTDREFIITADDLLFPKGYSERIMANYLALNPHYPKIGWTFCACQMHHQHLRGWQKVNGIDVLPTSISQSAGAIFDRELCERIGYFPNYGRIGNGDFAVNLRLEKLGVMRCYWRDPLLDHIGADSNKRRDYPDLHAFYWKDDHESYPHGSKDDGCTLPPTNTFRIVGRKE